MVLAAGLGLGFVWYAFRVLRMPPQDTSMKAAKAMFGFSLIYLFGLFATLLVDGFIVSIGA